MRRFFCRSRRWRQGILFLLVAGKLLVPAFWRGRVHTVPLMFLVMALLSFASASFCSALLSRRVFAWVAGGILCFLSALILQAPIDRWFDNA